ncbi:MAG TPA: type II secretion system protein [Pyrinomonadaceae bacterium]|nr:type II secretion system protein [Pyrinomonadaceae bacterium]
MREKSNQIKKVSGFTLIEVLIAASIMIILCVGTLSVFSYAVKINAGNNLRSQALTVLQAEAEYYRSLKFVPNTSVSNPLLNAGTYTRPQRTSADGTVFNVTVTITNKTYSDPAAQTEANCTLKEITIDTVMANPQPGWLANLRTKLTILRVRLN